MHKIWLTLRKQNKYPITVIRIPTSTHRTSSVEEFSLNDSQESKVQNQFWKLDMLIIKYQCLKDFMYNKYYSIHIL